MSAMAISIRTVTKTGGTAAIQRAASIMTRDRRPRRGPPSRRDWRCRKTSLTLEGEIRAIEATRPAAGPAAHALTRRYTRGDPMRGLLRGFAAITLVAAVAVAGYVTSVSSQTKPGARKLDLAYLLSPPESGAVGLKFMAEEVTRRSNGSINMVFHGGTLLNKELEIMDAVKSGNLAIRTPPRAAAPPVPP